MSTLINHGFIGTWHKEMPWQPGANTIAYYNIDDNDSSTIYDKSGNNRNLTYTANSYTTLSGPGKVMNLTGSQYASGTALNAGNTYTFIIWCNFSTISGYFCTFGQNASSSKRPSIALSNDNTNKFRYYSNSGTPLTGGTITTGTRYCVCGTRVSSGTIKLYINGILSNEASSSTAPDYSSGEGFYLGLWRVGEQYMRGYIKSFILENKVRTAQEVADYYNLTKSKYGL